VIVADIGVQYGLVRQCVTSVSWNSRPLCHRSTRTGDGRSVLTVTATQTFSCEQLQTTEHDERGVY